MPDGPLGTIHVYDAEGRLFKTIMVDSGEDDLVLPSV